MSETARSTCPMACTLDLVGDRWTLLVLRDLLLGKCHFDELLHSAEGIATNVLSERLQRLQRHGMIESAVCADNRRKKRYVLTERGRSFAPVMAALARWGLEQLEGTVPDPTVHAALEAERKRRRHPSS